MALLVQELRSTIVSLLLLYSWCGVGLSQVDPSFAGSLRELEERVSCLEGTLDQVAESLHPNDCSDISTQADGVYTIQPNGSRPFRAFCKFDSEGGWTFLQRRVNGDTDFQRSWTSYRNGFGQLSYASNFWLGLEKMYQITRQSRQYKLRVDLLGWGGETTHAEYSLFYINDEDANYAIFYHGYSGTAGDQLGSHHWMAEFSTVDRDNDNHDDAATNCAKDQGPWWLNSCDTSNLNGRYGQGTNDNGVEWGAIKAFKETTMRIRPAYSDELGWQDL